MNILNIEKHNRKLAIFSKCLLCCQAPHLILNLYLPYEVSSTIWHTVDCGSEDKELSKIIVSNW